MSNCKFLCLILFFSISTALFSAPKVITDNRLESLNGFPTIGRGYTASSNTLQSVCFKNIVRNKPTFNLNYDIEEINDDYFNQVQLESSDRLKGANFNSFIRKYYRENETVGGKNYNLKNIMVKIEISTYYYAMDETRSPLSESVNKIMKNKQYVTFFNSCGYNYIRSVGSFATYIALLQYRMSGNVSDELFQNKLENGLFNFYKSKKDDKLTADFEKSATGRRLKVFIRGIGLSKGNMVNLIPTDIKQFRSTIQDAVKLMQDPNSGVVNMMEIVPWIENPEFQSLFEFNKGSQSLQEFIQRQRLESNSSVITRIYKISNDQVERFNIASMCKKNLYRNYIFHSYIDKDLRYKRYDHKKTLFFNISNIRNRDDFITLGQFEKYFLKTPPEVFLALNKKFLYGIYGRPGALDCINKLYEGGLDKIDFRQIPSCVRVLRYEQNPSSFIDQYCMPKAAQLVYEVIETDDDEGDVDLEDDKEEEENKKEKVEDKSEVNEK